MSLDLVRWGGGRLRVGPWRGDAQIAYVAPMADAAPATAEAVRRCCDLLAERGFAAVITAALGPAESRGFIEAGFTVRERLHLLAKELHDTPAAPSGPLRRGRRLDRPGVLTVDTRSFDSFWRLDDSGLSDAMAATPSSRLRVADDGHGVFGYAVSGRAGRRGFLQRLAVDPDHQRRGIGRALAIDGLRWMARRGAERAMVNTQEHNTNALSLYDDLGFRLQPGGLAVLQISLS
jgi:ribosomal protein S18 acetylase RimI-like enzyme